jgi:hypothetical protein
MTWRGLSVLAGDVAAALGLDAGPRQAADPADHEGRHGADDPDAGGVALDELAGDLAALGDLHALADPAVQAAGRAVGGEVHGLAVMVLDQAPVDRAEQPGLALDHVQRHVRVVRIVDHHVARGVRVRATSRPRSAGTATTRCSACCRRRRP